MCTIEVHVGDMSAGQSLRAKIGSGGEEVKLILSSGEFTKERLDSIIETLRKEQFVKKLEEIGYS
jgi:hypothetical protein